MNVVSVQKKKVLRSPEFLFYSILFYFLFFVFKRQRYCNKVYIKNKRRGVLKSIYTEK